MTSRFVGLVAVLCFVVGCPPPHGPAVPPLPSKGGPPWVEVTSPHFVIWTDSSEARGRVLAQQMEDYRRIVVGVLFANGEPKAPPTLVLALRDAEEVGAYVPKEFIAYASGGGTLFQPVIVIAADTDEADNHIFVHELTHAISFGVIPQQPKWFAEGLAGFFETVRSRPGSNAVEIGRPLDYIVARLRAHRPTPTEMVLACDQPRCMGDMYYATTWATFAFLASTRTTKLFEYIQRLGAIGQDESLRAAERTAWSEVFPDLPPERLDHEVEAWFASRTGIVIRYPIKSEKVVARARPLTDGDALAARGILRWLFTPDALETRAELDAALAADRTQLLARLLDTSIMGSVSVKDAREATTAHPDDWRAWWLLGRAARTGPDAIEAREKLCALVGADAPRSMPRGFCTALTHAGGT
jgi:hypothetical protein